MCLEVRAAAPHLWAVPATAAAAAAAEQLVVKAGVVRAGRLPLGRLPLPPPPPPTGTGWERQAHGSHSQYFFFVVTGVGISGVVDVFVVYCCSCNSAFTTNLWRSYYSMEVSRSLLLKQLVSVICLWF